MCERTSEHYRRVAGYRYDPAERLEKSRKYAEAAKKIRNGVSPDQVGVPGVGAGSPVDQGRAEQRSIVRMPARIAGAREK